jgi:hypothetical protein
VAVDPFGRDPWPFSTYTINIHSHERCKRHSKQYSQKRNSNIFYAYMGCATKNSTGHTIKRRWSRDSHEWITRKVSEQMSVSIECLTIFKEITADIYVVERDCCSVWWDFYENEQTKILTMSFLHIVASSLETGIHYNVGGTSDMNVLKTGKSTWHSVRSSQRTLREWSKNRSLRPQRMWQTFYCAIKNKWQKMCYFPCYMWNYV